MIIDDQKIFKVEKYINIDEFIHLLKGQKKETDFFLRKGTYTFDQKMLIGGGTKTTNTF